MAYKRVTIQDIADACGLSRNTVSKVFNDRGSVPEATRNAVIQKARELGYISETRAVAEAPASRVNNIALLACNLPSEYHFCNFFIPAFAERLSSYGYTLTVYIISPGELERRALPMRMSVKETAGILAIEVFDRDYMDMVCGIGLPTIFVDAYAKAFQSVLNCDMLLMENVASTMAITDHVISRGAKRLGFYGDIAHCNSFFERWLGFNMSLSRAGLPIDRSLCVLEKDRPYPEVDWVLSQIKRMEVLPEAFICGNDYLAIQLITALKKLGFRVPEDIMVAGFDGQPQSAVVEPALTTVQIPGAEIGRMAADIMMNRIQNPNHPHVTTYVRTTPVFRASTDRNNRV